MPALDTLVRIAGGLNLSFVMLAQAIEAEFNTCARAAADESAATLYLTQLSAKPGRPGRRTSKSGNKRSSPSAGEPKRVSKAGSGS